jgi:hypothetical protein
MSAFVKNYGGIKWRDKRVPGFHRVRGFEGKNIQDSKFKI